MALYNASKAFVHGLTRSIAVDHGPEIRCNAICPGYVFTPLVEGQVADTAKARGLTEEEVKRDVLLAAQPTKEFVTPEQVGAFRYRRCDQTVRVQS